MDAIGFVPHDEIAHRLESLVNRWVLIKNNGSLPQPASLFLPGTHVLGFLYVDHERGVRVTVRFCCEIDANDRVVIIRSLVHEDRVFWFLKYETLRILAVFPLSEAQFVALRLPAVPEGFPEHEPSIVRVRNNPDFRLLRCPGYPDDVQLHIPPDEASLAVLPGCGGDLVWGRIERQTEDGSLFCTLLNEPRFNSEFRKGGIVEVLVVRSGDSVALEVKKPMKSSPPS